MAGKINFGSIAGSAETALGFGLLDPFLLSLKQGVQSVWPNVPPDAGELAALHAAGLLSTSAFQTLCTIQGIAPVVWDGTQFVSAVANPLFSNFGSAWAKVFNAQQEYPDLLTTIQMKRQAIIDQAAATEWMKRAGAWNDGLRAAYQSLADNVIPSPDTLVSFALREAWDAATVQRFAYDAEFPPEFGAWMKAQGADGKAPPGGPGPAGANDPSWAQLYWRVHWTALSPNLAYEMFQRLRANRVERLARDLPGLRAFTFADLQQVLKINDYPVPFRPQLAAIAYRRPRLVDIDRFFQNGAINRQEVYELHLDLGYSPADAETRTNWLVTKSLGAKLPQAHNNPIAPILEAYRVGTLWRNDARNMLVRTLSNGQFIDAAERPNNVQQQGVMDQYLQTVEQLLTSVDLQAATKIAREGIQATKRQYLRGMISEEEARAQLRQIGIQPARVSEYIVSWQRILQSGRLLLSTHQIRDMVVDGILPITTGELYLTNLGWKEPELSYIMAQVSRDIQIEQQRQAERTARTQRQQQQAQQRQASLLQRQHAEVIRRLNRQATPAQLERYYVRGIINEQQFTQELQRRGYQQIEIQRRLTVAQNARADYRGRHGPPAAGTNVPGLDQIPAEATPTGAQGQGG